MGACKVITVVAILKLIIFVGAISFLNTEFFVNMMRPAKPALRSQWWGKEPNRPAKEDTSIKKFTINVSNASLNDLNSRLEKSRFVEPMKDSNFQYGFNAAYLKKIITHWHKHYNWRAWEKKLNSFPQFTTEIDGLRIHYIHAKPVLKKGAVSIPILLVHGWPGSVVEFYKVIPLLTKAGFEVVAPSLPGYGWSQATPRPGMDCLETARLFLQLMEQRLAFNRPYYVQGGDWGSMIASNIAKMRPDSIRGLHLNMAVVPFHDPRYWIRLAVGAWFPSLVLPAKDIGKIYPYGQKMFKIMDFSGYFHLQATRPDTAGAGLIDSPTGLAAYILEKFSGWTVAEHKNLADGGLAKAFTMDELITNLMVYWTSDSIASSMRYYKENINRMGDEEVNAWQKQLITVPVGAAASPHEIANAPEAWFRLSHPNLLQYTDMERGGHFLAFEEPELFTKDVISFMEKTESYWRKKKTEKTEL